MNLKKTIAIIMAIATLFSIMTVGAFAAETIDWQAKAEENCFTSGSIGSAESTGNLGADIRAAKGNEPQDAGTGLTYTNTAESVTNTIQWTLKDGVLTLSGSGTIAKKLEYVFGGNEHIETLVIEESINYFPQPIKSLPNLKTIIIMDGNIQGLTLFADCPNVQAVIVGANLKDSIYSGFKGRSGEYSGEMASKFIILTKNIGLNYKGAQLRSDFNGYSNGTLCVQDGKAINNYASLAYHSDDVSTTSYENLLGKAQSVIATLPASVQEKLPAELTSNSNANDYIAKTTFSDVPADAYYADAVKWAVERNITNGTEANKFSPDNTCTEAQILTFIWRASGEPKSYDISRDYNPFKYVKTTDYFYNAVHWAYDNGIINENFQPDTPCSRITAVKYIWSAKGDTVELDKIDFPFTDVTGQKNQQAVAWALQKNITTGTSANTFSPDDICTRGQIVTFLYRSMA